MPLHPFSVGSCYEALGEGGSSFFIFFIFLNQIFTKILMEAPVSPNLFCVTNDNVSSLMVINISYYKNG